jgi:hypothetical protein
MQYCVRTVLRFPWYLQSATINVSRRISLRPFVLNVLQTIRSGASTYEMITVHMIVCTHMQYFLALLAYADSNKAL